jgi:hypothetical protein
MPRVMLEQHSSDVKIANQKFNEIFNDCEHLGEDALRARHITIEQFNIILRIIDCDVQLTTVTKIDDRLVPAFTYCRGESDAL